MTFSGNVTSKSGGAIFNDGYDGESSPSLSNVTFSGNQAGENGGAMLNTGTNDGMVGVSSPSLVNVTFSGNTASGYGGAMYNWGDSGGTSTPSLSNVILWGNTATTGGAQIYNNSSAPLISDSVAQGGCPAGSSCTNVISEDPLLDALTDFTLSGTSGGPGLQVYPLLSGSSAIDAGDDTVCAAAPVNNLDQRGEIRPQGKHCDIGAYEFRKAFSWSMFLPAILAPK